jgi:hypothetical protein
LLPFTWPSTEPDLNILYWGLLNNVLGTIVELSQKNRKLHNTPNDVGRISTAVSHRAMNGRSQLAASILKSVSLIDHCLPSTIQTTHVQILVKAVGFTVEEISTNGSSIWLSILWNLWSHFMNCRPSLQIALPWWNSKNHKFWEMIHRFGFLTFAKPNWSWARARKCQISSITTLEKSKWLNFHARATWLVEFPTSNYIIWQKLATKITWLAEFPVWKNLIEQDLDDEIM